MGLDLFLKGGPPPERPKLELGPRMGRFIELAARDFPHAAVLALLRKNRNTRYRVGEIARVLGESRRRVADVLRNLEKAELIRAEGVLGRSYRYDTDTPHEPDARRFVKLWENPVTHEAVMRKILEQK